MALVPMPNVSRAQAGSFTVNSRTAIEYADLFSPDAFRGACSLRDGLAARYGATVEVRRAKGDGRNAVLVGTQDDPEVAAALKAAAVSAADRGKMRREGYILIVRNDRAVIAGHDGAGLFYGVQTFLQLVERRGAGLRVPCGRHVDWPAHPFRGVHIYVPPKAEVDYFLRLIRYFAACKVNSIILEIAAAMEFKRHPEINRAWEAYCRKARDFPFTQGELQCYNTLHGRGKDSNHTEQGGGSYLSHDDMRAIARCARENHVSIVPEVQSPGHAYWMCLAHPDVAEWQGDKYPDTFCPSNPKSYELLFDVMGEVIDVLEPEWVSSGNDEYYFYAVCPRCRERSGHDILADHLNKVNGFLRARGVKHMMWADKLIHSMECAIPKRPEYGTGRMIEWGGGRRVLDDAAGKYVQKATWGAIDKIPDDLVMVDWYHGLSPDTEQYFAKHGKDVVFGNIGPFTFAESQKRARLFAPNVHGGEISTWIENGEQSFSHSNWPLQVAITGDVLWSEIYRKADPRKRMDVFAAFWRDHRNMLYDAEHALVTRKPGAVKYEALKLEGAATAAAPKIKVGRGDYHVPFNVARSPIVLSAGDTKGVTIPIGRQVRAIVFLQGATVRAAEVSLPPLYEFIDYKEYYLSREIGAMSLKVSSAVADARRGIRQGRVPLRLGFEVGSLLEPFGLTGVSRPTFCDPLMQADGSAVYAWEWVNPNPENLVIDEITLARGRSDIAADMVIYGITLVL